MKTDTNKEKNNDFPYFTSLTHEHIDYPVITKHWLIGYVWSKRCSVCGRIIEGGLFDENGGALRKNNKNSLVTDSDCFSLKEIIHLYPNQEIYNYKDNNCNSRKYVRIV